MTADKTDFTIRVLVLSPGRGDGDHELGLLIPPQKIKDMKTWKDAGRNIALAFYRAYSGDLRGAELVKEFDDC